MDPYLFENFDTVDGDRLMAKFRAFKFPDTTYVQFRSTVNACVDKCQGIKCSNGQIGYGRRKRDVMQSPEPNKVFEISKTTFIRVSGEPATAQDEGILINDIYLFLSPQSHHKNIKKNSNAIFFVPEKANELTRRLDQLKLANQKLQRNSRGSVLLSITDEYELNHHPHVHEANEPIHIQAQVTNPASASFQSITIILLALTFSIWTQRRH